ncbi:MAG: hypothetical protein ABI240_09600 [Sphingomonas sp.]
MWHGYQSLWLAAALIEPEARAARARSWFAASRYWDVAFHFNTGLAGADPETIAALRDTSMNPEVLDAFALAIIACDGPTSYPG